MLTRSLFAAAFACAAVPAAAIEIDLPGEEQRVQASYRCEDGTALAVEFINIGDNSLAVIRIDGGDPLVFANVVSGSGARYTAQIYEFWEARGEASFSQAGGKAVTCTPVSL